MKKKIQNIKTDSILIRYSEIALKGSNRSSFEKRLVENIKLNLKNSKTKFTKIERKRGRIIIKTTQEPNLKKVLGINSFSYAIETKNKTELKNKLKKIVKDSKGTFRVTGKRDICNEIGEFIIENSKLKVNLTNYELNIGIDKIDTKYYIYFNKIESYAGLPVGSSGKALCMLSGGIDSPVAAFLMMKRGALIDFIHFQNNKYTNEKIPTKIKKLFEKLKEYSPNSKIIVVPMKEIQKEIIKKCDSRYRIVLLRRIFFRIAESMKNYKAIITGDNIGQVASQTLENLNAIQNPIKKLIIRPLAGFNKQEIVNLAKEIETFNYSIENYDDCCSLLVPKHPITKAKQRIIDEIEKKITLM